MIADLGYTTVILGLLLAAYGMGAAALATWWPGKRQEALAQSAERAGLAVFALMTLAVLLMEVALVTHDFSVGYVARNGSRSTPLFYTIISLWASLEGSILFWEWLLALFTALVILSHWRRKRALTPSITAILLGTSTFFLLVMAFPANPFQKVFPVPADGPGPNPLLQNHPIMAIHPPMLYLGYVGFTVPFAFAMSALITGRLGNEWLAATRRWTLLAWTCLTTGIILGGWWSYEVLGWGGYWAWDPVENASFMPWLTGTAYLHSVMIQERRGMLKVWNLSLIVLTFALTLFGTFLTRSGVIASVHAFSDSSLGAFFLIFIGIVLIGSISLLTYRSHLLKTRGDMEGLISRESAFLLNNLLLVAFTFTVFLGTIFPILAEAVRGVKVSVGAPFFNQVSVPLSLLLLFLMGTGPMVAWRRASLDNLRRNFLLPAIIGGVAGVITFILGVRRVYPLLAIALSIFVLAIIVIEFIKGTQVRMRRGGESFPIALATLIERNTRRYGGFIVHIGVAIIAIAITASSAYKVEREVTLNRGEAMQIGDYRVRFENLEGYQEPHRFVVRATLQVWKEGQPVGLLQPRMNFYQNQRDPIGSPAVHYSLKEDLYLVLGTFDQQGQWITVTAMISPLITWLWIGGGVILCGAIIAAWPSRRQRELQLRKSEQERNLVEVG